MYTPFIDLDAIPCQTIHLSFQDTNMIISGLVLFMDSLISQPLLNKPNNIQISPELRGIWSNMWSNMFWRYLPHSWTNLNVLGLVWKPWIGTVIYSHCGTSAHLPELLHTSAFNQRRLNYQIWKILNRRPTSAGVSIIKDSVHRLEYQSHKPLLNIGWPHLYSLWYMVILYVSISWVLKN